MALDYLKDIIPLDVGNFTTNFTFTTDLLTFSDSLDYLMQSTNGSAYLFMDGCGPSRDCHQACLHVDTAFQDAQTLQNCMQYPLIAGHLDQLKDPDSLVYAASMGITEQSSTDADKAYDIVSGCLESYFEAASKLPGAPQTGKPGCYGADFTIDQGVCYLDICDTDYLYAPLNPDIGGIGVYISYYMQVGLALLFFVGIKICTSWTYWISRTVSVIFGSQRSRRWARDMQDKAKWHLDPLSTAAVEFHKAQCIFMLAVQMASQIVLHKNNLLDSSSLQQVYNNYFVIGVVSIGGFLPITFTLACLHIADVRSWYLWILSGFTIAVSLSTMYVAESFTPHPEDVGSAPTPSKQCGTANPVKFCLNTDLGNVATWTLGESGDSGRSGGLGTSILMFSLLIYIILLVDLCIHTFAHFEKWVRQAADEIDHVKHTPTFSSLQRHTKSAITRLLHGHVPTRLVQLLFWIIYLAAIGAYLFFFERYIHNLGVPLFFGFTNDWTFGQIVAITIWAPSIFELVYLESRGMKKGLAYRISKRWKLVEIPENDKDENDRGETDTSRISQFLQRPWMTMLGIDDTPIRKETRGSEVYKLVGATDAGPVV